MKYLTSKQREKLAEIASSYPTLYCVQFALALKKYLKSLEIKGKVIKINTQADLDYRNCFIYDDSIGGDAISETGYHEGVLLTVDDVEMVFDNHHLNGTPKKEWLANFQFFGKIHLGQELVVIEEEF
ncbi:papain fold toxin domain-containing protein [Spirulina subsalsa]|uniref:papain fold toxin domain-containing protein n=1 Tax=Spirulina subsalsa TaxID=54311 RepID=UPI0003111005|nr:papain fold toxin domain-containing protein [Spirulina subsalsa]